MSHIQRPRFDAGFDPRCAGGYAAAFDTGFAGAGPPRGGAVTPAVAVAARLVPGWPSGAKRTLDLVLVIPLLVLFALPMAVIAAWIRRDSPGPALFRQRRVGLHGRPFAVFKFRTMRIDAPPPSGRRPICRQATRDDPRVTRPGAWLRRFSIDELPQLLNVLRGEMSLVGPRPHAPGTCAGGRPFEQVAAAYAARHRVRPGITGLAQVRGWRGETETEDKLRRRVECDLEYIARWSLRLDLVILLRTLPAVLRATNAY